MLPEMTPPSEDYRDLRDSAALLDLSGWCLLRLTGSDTMEFLQGTATQDLSRLEPNHAATTLFLNEKGRPVAHAWVWLDSAGGAWIAADEGARATLRPHFERFRIMEDVEFESPGEVSSLWGIAGPTRDERASAIVAESPEMRAIHAEPLSFLLATADTPRRAPVSADPAAAEAWRLWAGLPRTGVDFDLDRIATELSLPDTISLSKGCYVGQEVVARTSNRGQVRRHRFGFRFPWPGQPLEPRAEIRAGDLIAGYVTSTAREPGSSSGLGMGYATTETLQNPVGIVAVGDKTTTPLEVIPWHQ